MNSLLKFIIRHSFTIAFVLIEIICFILIVYGNNYQKAKYTNSSNFVTGKISEKWSNIVDYTKLKSINNSLAEENEILRNTLEKYRTDNIPPLEKSGFEYCSAKVVWVKNNQIKNFLTINKGIDHNINQGMGVIGPDGVVGVTYVSSDKYTSVLPIINPDTKISVKLKESDYFGSLSWDGGNINTATITGIPGHAQMETGDLVVTSNLSSIFPENISVGKVKEFYKDVSTNFYTIKIELFTDFSKINYVYVITNKDSVERDMFNYN